MARLSNNELGIATEVAIQIWKVTVWEKTFGASTECKLKFEDGICIDVEDTSTHTTNWEWDRWSFNLEELKGLTVFEISIFFKGYFKDFKSEYRVPYCIMRMVSFS